MKKLILVAVAGLTLSACKSIEEAQLSSSDFAAKGDAIAVVQASSIGFTAFLHNVVIVDSNLDQVVNKMLVAEAKAMGSQTSKVELLSASTSATHGIFAVPAVIVGFPSSQATGIVLK
jgi:hypothetical protein